MKYNDVNCCHSNNIWKHIWILKWSFSTACNHGYVKVSYLYTVNLHLQMVDISKGCLLPQCYSKSLNLHCQNKNYRPVFVPVGIDVIDSISQVIPSLFIRNLQEQVRIWTYCRLAWISSHDTNIYKLRKMLNVSIVVCWLNE